MLCEDCRKQDATVHMKQVINGQKVVLNLCSNCAKRRGFSNPLKNIPFPLADFLTSMVSGSIAEPDSEMTGLTCSSCGLTYDKFAKTGRLGCGECFNTFRQPLADLLRKIHGSNLHRGKRQSSNAEGMDTLKEEARLKDELKTAITNEDFERAAQIRDLIKDIQAKMETSDVR
ncbi:MAG: UvrB/UvrC motif-containing protein [Candidatus Zixiibacteriota bacterium]